MTFKGHSLKWYTKLTETHQNQSQVLRGNNIQTKDQCVVEMHGVRCCSQPVYNSNTKSLHSHDNYR